MTSLSSRTASSLLRVVLTLTSLVLLLAAAAPMYGQTFTKLYDFGSPGDPVGPGGLLAQGRDGNLYSATYSGGANDLGAVFRITTDGKLTILHSFDRTHGANPQGGVTLGSDGNFYSTTAWGGAFDLGILFKITSDGTVTTMHSFSGGDDRGDPRIPPILGSDGNLYGETSDSVYKMTRPGTLTTLHQFTEDGDIYGPLVQATDGNFYGATGIEIFMITPGGQFTRLYQSGANCCFGTSLVQGKNGIFYGTLSGGGGGHGSVFAFGLGGPLRVLHDFSGSDGSSPILQPMVATDGNLYGVTGYGGTAGLGTIYRLGLDGDFSVLYHFDGVTGSRPWQMLTQHTNGLLYGTASGGGAHNDGGTFFSLDAGLAPFAKLVSDSGQVGKHIGILGQGFTGTSSVSFSGVFATFNVASDTYLEALVPDGALTGSVTVTTPTGSLASNTIFRVTPKVLSFNPTSGAVGTTVVITGTGLRQALRVGFGGVAATSFTVDSDTQVTAIVPLGAVTGNIAIATQGGHDRGTRVFTVTP